MIYFMKPVGMDGPIKIGRSRVPRGRLGQLSVWSPWPLEIIVAVPGKCEDEQFLHGCFADCHSHHEWFRSTPKLRETIESIRLAGNLDGIRTVLSPVGSIRSKRPAKFSADRKRYLSYMHRINNAQRKLRAWGDDTAWYAPEDVGAIIGAWNGCNRLSAIRIIPSDEQIARLEEYLANPAAHSVHPSWRRAAA